MARWCLIAAGAECLTMPGVGRAGVPLRTAESSSGSSENQGAGRHRASAGARRAAARASADGVGSGGRLSRNSSSVTNSRGASSPAGSAPDSCPASGGRPHRPRSGRRRGGRRPEAGDEAMAEAAARRVGIRRTRRDGGGERPGKIHRPLRAVAGAPVRVAALGRQSSVDSMQLGDSSEPVRWATRSSVCVRRPTSAC